MQTAWNGICVGMVMPLQARHWFRLMKIMYPVTVDMRQHCTDGSFRLCRWRAHTEALSEDSGPEAPSTHGQYFALQVFYAILQPIAGELSANCCRTITMTRYRKQGQTVQSRHGAGCFTNPMGLVNGRKRVSQ